MELGLFSGRVVAGKGRGKSLGIATANLDIDPPIPPGVYIGEASVSGKKFYAAISCGNSPYFGDIEKNIIEVHLLDGECNRGDIMSVTVWKFLRPQRKDFSSVEDLISTINQDILSVREYFAGPSH